MLTTSKQKGYLKGRIDGYHRGKEQGLTQARAEIISAEVQRREAQLAEEEAKKQVHHILVITSSPIPSLEIGIIQPFNLMQEKGEITYTLKLVNEVAKDDVKASTDLVFVRTVESKAFELLEWAHDYDKNTIYYIDDNFMAIDPNTSIGMYYLTPKRLRTYIKFLKHARVIKVDSNYFGNYIREHFNPNVAYFPGSVDFALLDELEKPAKRDSQLVIGYEGGHKESAFVPVVPALLKICDYYGGFVKLEFLGFTPSELIGHPNVTSRPSDPNYREFIKYLYQSNWDIGIAPLEDNHFNHCKTNNKFREYSACGIPGIYTNIPPYADWITHAESGYLVDNTEDEWHKALVTMIENATLRDKMREASEAIARAHFTVPECTVKWKTILSRREDG